MSSRLMRVLTRDGVIDVPIEAGSDDASTLGSYWNAIQQFLDTGNVEVLAPFQGVFVGGLRVRVLSQDVIVGGHRLETDPDWIEYWAL